MSYWNYRILNTKDGYQVCEAHYNSMGELWAHSDPDDPIVPWVSNECSPDDLIKVLERMLEDCKRSKNHILIDGEIKYAKPDWE